MYLSSIVSRSSKEFYVKLSEGLHPNLATFGHRTLGKFSTISLKLGLLMYKMVCLTSSPTVIVNLSYIQHLGHSRYLKKSTPRPTVSIPTYERTKNTTSVQELPTELPRRKVGSEIQRVTKTTRQSIGVPLWPLPLTGAHQPEGWKRQLTRAHPLSHSPQAPTRGQRPHFSPDSVSRRYFLWTKAIPFSSSSQRTS